MRGHACSIAGSRSGCNASVIMTEALLRHPCVVRHQKLDQPVDAALGELARELLLINADQPGAHHVDIVDLPAVIGQAQAVANLEVVIDAADLALDHRILAVGTQLRGTNLKFDGLAPNLRQLKRISVRQKELKLLEQLLLLLRCCSIPGWPDGDPRGPLE